MTSKSGTGTAQATLCADRGMKHHAAIRGQPRMSDANLPATGRTERLGIPAPAPASRAAGCRRGDGPAPRQPRPRSPAPTAGTCPAVNSAVRVSKQEGPRSQIGPCEALTRRMQFRVAKSAWCSLQTCLHVHWSRHPGLTCVLVANIRATWAASPPVGTPAGSSRPQRQPSAGHPGGSRRRRTPTAGCSAPAP